MLSTRGRVHFWSDSGRAARALPTSAYSALPHRRLERRRSRLSPPRSPRSRLPSSWRGEGSSPLTATSTRRRRLSGSVRRRTGWCAWVVPATRRKTRWTEPSRACERSPGVMIEMRRTALRPARSGRKIRAVRLDGFHLLKLHSTKSETVIFVSGEPFPRIQSGDDKIGTTLVRVFEFDENAPCGR